LNDVSPKTVMRIFSLGSSRGTSVAAAISFCCSAGPAGPRSPVGVHADIKPVARTRPSTTTDFALTGVDLPCPKAIIIVTAKDYRNLPYQIATCQRPSE